MGDDALDLAEFLPEFLTEAAEHLAAMDEILLDAEQHPDDPQDVVTERIHALFRAAHTLKGMAGMMGLSVFTGVAHRLEQQLDARRSDPMGVSAAYWRAMVNDVGELRVVHERLSLTGSESGNGEVAAAAAAVAPDGKAAAATSARSGTVEPARAATSIRVDTARLDQLLETVGELAVLISRLNGLTAELAELARAPGGLELRRQELGAIAQQQAEVMQAVKRANDELQEDTMRVRMLPISVVFGRFPRVVRDVADSCGKQARLVIAGGETELDKTVIEQIGDPLIHLLRNAIDHGLELPDDRVKAGKPACGVVKLSACQRGPSIVITVEDDGRGMDRARLLAKARSLGWFAEGVTPSDGELLAVIFRPGFTTAEQVTSLSGRGVGMDVVHQNIQRLGGTIGILSEPGKGTRFTIKLPLTLVSAKALLARVGGRTFALPLAAVQETLRLDDQHYKVVHGKELLCLRDQIWPLERLGRWSGTETEHASPVGRPAVIVGDGEQHMALLVDELVGQQDVVMKSLGDFLGPLRGIGGATILGDGRVAMIVDATSMIGAARGSLT